MIGPLVRVHSGGQGVPVSTAGRERSWPRHGQAGPEAARTDSADRLSAIRSCRLPSHDVSIGIGGRGYQQGFLRPSIPRSKARTPGSFPLSGDSCVRPRAGRSISATAPKRAPQVSIAATYGDRATRSSPPTMKAEPSSRPPPNRSFRTKTPINTPITMPTSRAGAT